MNWRESFETVVNEARDLLSTLKEQEVKAFLTLLEEYRQKRIFFWARGRSFLILKGFAMRLMHMGYTVHVVGEVTCPAIGKGDLLLCASGSGKTASVLLFAEKAKKAGAKVAAIVGRPETPLHPFLDWVVKFVPDGVSPSLQLYADGGGTRFEHALFLFLDACILHLVSSHREEAYKLMMACHANLE
ncbi:MAG: SIS domain-containing protein [Atribacterota bacterium]